MNTIHKLLDEIREGEVVALTRDLVRIPSVYRSGDPEANESRVAAFVEAWFRREGFHVEVQLVAPGRPNVIAWLDATGSGPSLLLEGHTDVVTEGDPTEWSHPPFAADVVDGKLYGRGATDMKSGLAAAMIAAAAFRRAGVSLRGRLVVGALVDEEGGMLGVHHLCTTPVGKALSAAIICEPEQNEICLEQRGVVWARLRVRGRMAHGAMPEAGVNSIEGIGTILRELPALRRRLRRICTRSRHLRPPTVTPTVLRSPIQGVAQPNVIPSGSELILDVRLTPGIDGDEIRRAIERLCRQVESAQPGIKVEWEPLGALRLPTKVAKGEPLVRAMVAAVKTVTGKAPRYGGVPGSTDGTILRTVLGIPIVTYGPGNRLIPHQVDEYVEIKELIEAAQVYAVAALKFLEG
ncbi:MAG: M20 family metallopeptidase [Candidatus Rokubacteria bacterium]|nr:M20 family metallopeptidase [Candidatus Rokubacteria bacterium]